jgi:hypothetical protein
VALAVALAPPAGAADGEGGKAAAQAAAHERLELTFKVDPRLTRGLYMGDRWVSPPRYSAHLPADAAVVDARAQRVGATGRRSAVPARWTAGDPAMVSVTPGSGAEVRLRVLREGESRVEVDAAGLARGFSVKALRKEAVLQVEIVPDPLPPQVPADRPAADPPARSATASVTREDAGYAVGVYLGRRLGLEGWDVDGDALSRGLADALGKGPVAMSDAEVAAIVSQLRRGARPRAARAQP